MANQPENTPKGQIKFNSGAKPPTKVTEPTHMKGIKHQARLNKANEATKGNA